VGSLIAAGAANAAELQDYLVREESTCHQIGSSFSSFVNICLGAVHAKL
jgi:hypothetical protein